MTFNPAIVQSVGISNPRFSSIIADASPRARVSYRFGMDHIDRREAAREASARRSVWLKATGLALILSVGGFFGIRGCQDFQARQTRSSTSNTAAPGSIARPPIGDTGGTTDGTGGTAGGTTGGTGGTTGGTTDGTGGTTGETSGRRGRAEGNATTPIGPAGDHRVPLGNSDKFHELDRLRERGIYIFPNHRRPGRPGTR